MAARLAEGLLHLTDGKMNKRPLSASHFPVFEILVTPQVTRSPLLSPRALGSSSGMARTDARPGPPAS